MRRAGSPRKALLRRVLFSKDDVLHEGPAVKDFEGKLAARCQRRQDRVLLPRPHKGPCFYRHGIACANGTAALDIAVQASGIP